MSILQSEKKSFIELVSYQNIKRYRISLVLVFYVEVCVLIFHNPVDVVDYVEMLLGLHCMFIWSVVVNLNIISFYLWGF